MHSRKHTLPVFDICKPILYLYHDKSRCLDFEKKLFNIIVLCGSTERGYLEEISELRTFIVTESAHIARNTGYSG